MEKILENIKKYILPIIPILLIAVIIKGVGVTYAKYTSTPMVSFQVSINTTTSSKARRKNTIPTLTAEKLETAISDISSITKVIFGKYDDYSNCISESWNDDGEGVQIFIDKDDSTIIYILTQSDTLKLSADCSSIFEKMTSLTTIEGKDILDTSDLEDTTFLTGDVTKPETNTNNETITETEIETETDTTTETESNTESDTQITTDDTIDKDNTTTVESDTSDSEETNQTPDQDNTDTTQQPNSDDETYTTSSPENENTQQDNTQDNIDEPLTTQSLEETATNDTGI
jgi:hypothetical protein